MSSAASEPPRRASPLARPDSSGRPGRSGARLAWWALFLFCLAEGLACALLARACIVAAWGHPDGWQPAHAAGLAAVALLGAAAMRSWPGWWRTAAIRFVGMAGEGRRIIVAGPDGSRREAEVAGDWCLGNLLFLVLAGQTGCMILPWQADDSREVAALRRCLRVVRKVQPERPSGERR